MLTFLVTASAALAHPALIQATAGRLLARPALIQATPCRLRCSAALLQQQDYRPNGFASLKAQRAELESQLERGSVKQRLLRLFAACNRGFGATPADRRLADSLIQTLCKLRPSGDLTAGISVEGSEAAHYAEDGAWMGRGYDLRTDDAGIEDAAKERMPLAGVWRLVYTDAPDVLSLDANPIAGVGPIYQASLFGSPPPSPCACGLLHLSHRNPSLKRVQPPIHSSHSQLPLSSLTPCLFDTSQAYLPFTSPMHTSP